jgi:hypothetical protein
MLAVLISLPAARVSIEGFAPPEATPGFVLREYQRIYALLAGERDRRVDTITVIFYTHAATGGAYRLPEWGGGGAIGADTIVIPMDANPFLYDSPSRTVIHELAHIVVNRLAPRMRVPRWFHEGVAMMVAGDVTFREQVIVSRAIFTGSLTPLAHIDSVNAFGRSRARLAYSQSRLAVEYLVNAYGVEVLAEILASGNARRGFYKGIHDVLGLRRDEIHGLIEEHIQKRFGPIVWLGDTYLLWLGMFVLFVAGVIATAIRNRGKRLRMEAEEEEEEERAGELHQ